MDWKAEKNTKVSWEVEDDIFFLFVEMIHHNLQYINLAL